MTKWLNENENCASPLVDENIDDDALATKTIDIKVFFFFLNLFFIFLLNKNFFF